MRCWGEGCEPLGALVRPPCVVCLVTLAESHCPHTHTHTHTHTGLYMHYNVSSSPVNQWPVCLQQCFPAARPPKRSFTEKNHSPHSNLCLACAFVLFGWSARADWIPTFLLIGGTPSAEDVSDPLPGEFAHESMTFQWGLLNSDQMELCALKQQHLWWARTHHRTGVCRQRSHEISHRGSISNSASECRWRNYSQQPRGDEFVRFWARLSSEIMFKLGSHFFFLNSEFQYLQY